MDQSRYAKEQAVRRLIEAIWEGETALPVVATLLDSGFSTNVEIGGFTVLYYALRRKQTKIAELLLKQGASANAPSQFSVTPLHVAAAVGDVQILPLLLSRGAKINAKDCNRCTPLWYAVKEGHLAVAQILLQKKHVAIDCHCEHSASSGFQYSESVHNYTAPLSLAVQNQDVDMVSLLLSKGAGLNAVDAEGQTPLHHSCQLKSLTIAEMLVQHGCLLDVTDTHGYTPVHIAVCQDASSIVRLLVQAGCDVNLGKPNSNVRPLHTASDLGLPEVAAILCTAKRIDVNCRDYQLKTPLIIACRSGNIECVKSSAGSGTDVNVHDSSCLTVFSLALSLEEEPSLIWRLSGVQKKSRSHVEDGCHGDEGKCSGGICCGNKSKCNGGHDNKEECGEGCCHGDKCDRGCFHGDEGNCDRESRDDKLFSCFQSLCRCFYSQRQENSQCCKRNRNYKKCFDHPVSPIQPSAHVSGGQYGAERINTDSPTTERDLNQSTQVENVAGTVRLNNHISPQTSNVTAKACSLGVLHALIQAGANLNLRDKYGKTALDYAFQSVMVQSTCLLMCHGAALETLISVVRNRRITSPRTKFVRPAVVALTCASFKLWNCLHHFFYREDFFDDDRALTEIMLKLQQPMTLARQSRCVIRQILMKSTNTSIAPLVRELPLPDAVKQFLLLSDVVQIVGSGNYC